MIFIKLSLNHLNNLVEASSKDVPTHPPYWIEFCGTPKRILRQLLEDELIFVDSFLIDK